MTPRERDCLEAIVRLTVDGVSPSFEMLSADLGMHKSSVHRLVHGLKDRGVIRLLDHRARSIQVVESPFPYSAHALAALPSPRLGEIRDSIEAILANRFADATGGNVTRFPPQLRTVK